MGGTSGSGSKLQADETALHIAQAESRRRVFFMRTLHKSRVKEEIPEVSV
jgi:hypothetical protein